MFLNVTNEQKILIDEIAALSGIQKNVIREVWEFTLVRWAEKLSTAGGSRAVLDVPFLGTVSVKYEGDIVEADGSVTTEVSSFVALDPVFKKLVGDINDEGANIVASLLEKKIENSAITTTTTSPH